MAYWRISDFLVISDSRSANLRVMKNLLQVIALTGSFIAADKNVTVKCVAGMKLDVIEIKVNKKLMNFLEF